MLPAVVPSFCGLPWNGEPAGRDREIYRRGPDGCEQTENLNRTAVYETRWKRKADVYRPST